MLTQGARNVWSILVWVVLVMLPIQFLSRRVRSVFIHARHDYDP